MAFPHVSVVGAGQVGATCAHLIALKGLAHVTMIDVVEGLAQGKALDMMSSAPVEGFGVSVDGSSDYAAMAQSQLVVVTAGIPRKPGMSREDLLTTNGNIIGPIAERVASLCPQAIVIIVTNPLDLMVALALRRSGFARNRVMGMAGILDSTRLRWFIAQRLGVAPTDVEATVLGSHGDLMVPVKSSITVQARPLSERLSDNEIEGLLKRTRDGGAEIVKLLKKGSAFYAPASGVVQMIRAILGNTHEVLPVCARLEGEYGLRDVCIGVPAQLGESGVERVVERPLSSDEKAALAASAQKVKSGIKELEALVAKTS